MRLASILLVLGFLQVSTAQSGSNSLFNTVVPDATVHVYKEQNGADLVEITMRAEAYPADLLRTQIESLVRFLGSKPRGIDVGSYAPDPAKPQMTFTKGFFAVDGVIDHVNGTLRINPLIQALAGAPKPWTITGVEIEFQGEHPTSAMPKRWSSRYVPGEGRFEGAKDQRLTGVEYRITLLSQDPTKFDIPEPGQKQAPEATKTTQSPSTDWVVIGVFVVAAGAVGALVYSLLLGGRQKKVNR
ncbi:MAG: hypothetical protein P4L46_04505 [Fimbriimonas sp.]|nr:hypothetical protein [Fimbriimonas sp.]